MFIPTTEQIRDLAGEGYEARYHDDHSIGETRFDRWLTIHDALVARAAAEKAWDEGYKQGGPMHDVFYGEPDRHTINPYRTGTGEDQ